ncbi:uncharacterized protein MELLADRAFT_85751 [Melampsora larici-populina 98AG31]|uniref:Uncharacterized protein n=1 Tax=Melampsora larici-populina (strain 98AG31 / pathotype 3-4-7) TaxID=747676 RepID=F4RJM9_MELLP|nr:uncharacterized protein MELLADRAFT_85751 [Melampsora larici-populina 98AG31]EGG07335.1 hypothetical protein MELLADRAFT_85751 [Melampsora larici-populina 98AG31]
MNNLREVLDIQLSSLGSLPLTDDQIRSLNLICGPELLIASMELIDKRSVSRLRSPMSDTLYQVNRNTKSYLVCITQRSTCQCSSFLKHVILSSTQITVLSHHFSQSIFFFIPF